MMTSLVALCADEASMAHPELIGLAGEQLFAQPWLRLFTSGLEIRTFLKHDRMVDEIWIVSCEDVEPINLAATLKGDRGDVRVCLVSFQGTGSLRSRASAASIDATLTRQAFVTRYAAFKRVRTAAMPPLDRDGKTDPQDSGPLFQPEEPVLAASSLVVDGARLQSGKVPPVEPPHLAVNEGDSPATRSRDAAGRPCPIGIPPKVVSDTGVDCRRLPTFASSMPDGAPVPPPGFAFPSGIGQDSRDGRQTSSSSAGDSRSDVSPSCQPEQPVSYAALQRSSGDALLLPIVSGSGGAGKSTIAVLSSLLAQRRGFKTLLLDFDLQFGDMREMTGQSEALGIDEVLADPARLTQLAPATGLPALLGAPRHLEDAESVVQRAPALLDAVNAMFDVIIANTGAAWAEQHAILLERCSKALFLIDQRGSSLTACRRALDLCARCGIAVNPFLFAVNFCAKGAPLTSIDVSCALRGARTIELVDGGAEVEEALSEGRPQDLIDSGNPLVDSLDALLADLLPATEESAEASGAPSPRKSRRRRRRRRKRGSS